jgi:hypothetical protein
MSTRGIAALSVLLVLCAFATPASAHGKEVQVTLGSWLPDPREPLTRLYEARVQYASDQEPVEGARLAFTASRQEDGTRLGDVAFVPISDSPGTYVAQIHYPRFGTWDISLRSVVPGEGEASTTELISPGSLGDASPAANGRSQERLAIVFEFDWADVFKILLRTVHSVAAATYLVLTLVLLLNRWFQPYLVRAPRWTMLLHAAYPAALGSLALLAISGMFTGYVDAPVRAPGVFNVEALATVPYGIGYVAAFWFKLALGIGVLVVASRARLPRVASVGASTGRLTVTFGLLSILLLFDVVVLVYLHNLSHLSVVVPLR